MKRGIILLLVLCMMLCMTACNARTAYPTQENIDFNYNNITADNSFFWLTNETNYYVEAPFVTINYYSVTSNERQKVTSALNGASAEIQAYDDRLLMLDFHNEDLYRLHSYDLDNGEHKEIGLLEEVYMFFAYNDHIYYLQENSSEDVLRQELYVCDMAGKAKVRISEDVFAVGVAGDKLVYLVRRIDEFSVFQYNDRTEESVLIGSFVCQLAEGECYERYVNFTSEQVILTVSGQAFSKLVCYDIHNDQVLVYQVDGAVWSAIAYEDYAFLIVIENPDSDTDAWKNVIYRLCLQDGVSERIGEVQGGLTDTFVGSDDYVYISNSLDRDIYCIDSNGNKILVFAF